MATEIPHGPKSIRAFAPVLFLLAVAVLINYVDRGNLAIAAPLLKDELHLSASQLGLLFSAFFSSYTVFIFVSGWLVDRFPVNWVLAAGFALWSAATAATGIAGGFAALFVMRLLLGAGESVAFPSCSKLLAEGLPEEYRGFANGVIGAGMKAGPAVGTLGAGLLMARYGWRPVFIGIGLGSLLWLPGWIRYAPRAAEDGRSISRGPSAADILEQRSFWGASLGHFCHNYVSYFMVSWLPLYLVRERGHSMETMAKVASAYYLADAAAAFATGWLTDLFIRRGRSVTFVRKAAMALGHSIVAVALAGCAWAGPRTYLPWLILVGLGLGTCGAGIFAFAQTLGGRAAAGRWAGLQNGFGNFSGVISPAVAGFILQWSGHFTLALGITAATSLIAVIAWTFIVGPLTEIDWARSGAVGGVAPSQVTDT